MSLTRHRLCSTIDERMDKKENPSPQNAVRSVFFFIGGCGLGAFLIWIGQAPKDGSWAWISPTMLLGAAIFVIANIAGMFAAGASITRGEKWPILSWFAMTLNMVPLVALLVLLKQ